MLPSFAIRAPSTINLSSGRNLLVTCSISYSFSNFFLHALNSCDVFFANWNIEDFRDCWDIYFFERERETLRFAFGNCERFVILFISIFFVRYSTGYFDTHHCCNVRDQLFCSEICRFSPLKIFQSGLAATARLRGLVRASTKGRGYSLLISLGTRLALLCFSHFSAFSFLVSIP